MESQKKLGFSSWMVMAPMPSLLLGSAIFSAGTLIIFADFLGRLL